MEVLSNKEAERAVIAGIFKYNGEGYFDVADLLDTDTFLDNTNKILYRCCENIFSKNSNASIDVPTILAVGHELGFSHFLSKEKESDYIKDLVDSHVSLKNMRTNASTIRNLQIARIIRKQMSAAGDDLLNITGNEGVFHILGIAESAVFDLSSLIKDNDNEPKRLTDGLYEYILDLGENPVEQLGISTGFKYFDASIGGGVRNGSITVIGARMKTGKTLLADAMGFYIAQESKIPVLNMDTEMGKKDHVHRIMAMQTECYIHDIETGKYFLKDEHKDNVLETAKKLESDSVPYYHISIAGMPFEEQLAVTRRWIIKNVGLNPDGTAKPCVLIYDYLKLMDTKELKGDMKEYQLLGFMMTTLHNFAVRYQIPIIAFMQLNRDGIDREDTDVAAGSDRILWLCSNFSIFKKKSDEEIAEDGPANGNRKLVPLVARHGSWEPKNYISCSFQGEIAKIKELIPKYDLEKKKKEMCGGSIVEGDDIPFE